MKKFLSLLLTFAMVFSLAMPAMAAEPTVSGNTSGNVTASYTPSSTDDTTAKITGVSITVDGEKYTSGNVTITPNTQSIIYTVTGTNFANVSAENRLSYAPGCGDFLNSSLWTIDTEANTATRDFSNDIVWFKNCDNFEVTYSNDYNTDRTWQSTGIYLTYDDGIAEEDKAQITGVSITVNDTKYTSGTATITPDTESIILNVTGTNLQNGTQDNFVMYASGLGDPVTQGRFEISDDGTSATYDLSSWKSYFEGCTTAFEIRYSNDGQATWIGSGIYVLYDDGNTTLYDVTVTDSEHGTVKAPPKSAENGQVFLTVIPDAGYQLGTLTATAGDGTTINPSDWDDGIYVFTMPAADVTVTATFVLEDTDTTPAEITSVSITVDGITYDSTNTSEENPAVITPDTESIILNVTGTNLQNNTNDNYVVYAEGHGIPLTWDGWTISDGTSATCDLSSRKDYFKDRTTAFEIQYSNDGQATWIDAGVYVIYDDGTDDTTAKITGVSITVDGVPYSSGNVTITPTSTVVFTVTGTNFANLSADNYLCYAPSVGSSLNSGWAIDTAANRVTLDFSDRIFRFESCDNFEVMYSNDGQQSWTGTGIYLTYNADTATTYTVTISENIANGTVTADPNSAKAGETVTVTVAAETGYAYVVNSLKVTNDTTGGEVEVNEDAKTFVMPASNVTVTAEFEKLSTISADIAWGSMSFTYSDDTAAWSCDVEGGDQVTVTNGNESAITASVEYKKATGYEAINGYFAAESATASADLNLNEAHTFTLTLSGKPTRALNGDTIGSVTVTITANTAAE